MTGYKSPAKSTIIKTGILVAVIIVLLFSYTLFDLQQILKDILAWISKLGPIAGIIFVLIYIAATIFFLPGAILTLGAGVIFGLLGGAFAVSIASILGAAAAFLIGRYLARDSISRKIAGNKKFEAIDEAVGRQGWKIVLLTRLSPVFPFNMLNYGFGLTKVSFKHYFWASWIGMLPGTIMYVYIGSLAGDLAVLGTGKRTRTLGEWILYGVGLLATIAVTVFITHKARKALKTKAPETVEE